MGLIDPLGYYARLGLTPSAPASVIKAAYRALAMEQHPDRDKGAGATQRFQALQQAFDVLSDPFKRAEYDASSIDPETPIPTRRSSSDSSTRRNSEDATSYEAIRCERCKSITASPRYRVFFRVFAYVFGAVRKPIQGIYCARCEMIEGAKSTGITVITGWWSLHGLVWTLGGLRQNLFGANAFAEQNAKLLAHQVGYFISTGNNLLALAIAREAYATALRVRNPDSKATKMRAKLGYQSEDRLKDLRENLKNFISSFEVAESAPQLRNSAGMFSSAFYAQAAIVGSLCIFLGGWLFVDYKKGVGAAGKGWHCAPRSCCPCAARGGNACCKPSSATCKRGVWVVAVETVREKKSTTI